MSLTGTTWAAIGPDPITEGTSNANGLVTSIAINPNNASVIYQGTAGIVRMSRCAARRC
jgi:hypothetical protein